MNPKRTTEPGRQVMAQDFYQVDSRIQSLEDLRVFARQFSTLLFPGLFLGLRGELGSGKTTLVREIVKALDCPIPEYVTSPTFVLIQEYPARINVSHMDLYRLEEGNEFLQMGGMEMFVPENIVMVEWVERMESFLPDNRLEILIQTLADGTRLISTRGFGLFRKLVENWGTGLA